MNSRVLFFIACGVIFNFPGSMPRFLAGTLYLPIVLLMFPILQSRSSYFFSFYVWYFFVVVPLMEIFRGNGFNVNVFSFGAFLSGQFDTFQSIANAIHSNLFSYGSQLLGVLLFFVPRNFWPDKPIGTGALVAEELNFSFTNVSLNFWAEMYINFGSVGAVIGSILLGSYMRWIDIKCCSRDLNQLHGMLNLGLLVFIVRGDLLNAFAYSIGVNLTFIFVRKLLVRKY